jgi:hypothetical protein
MVGERRRTGWPTTDVSAAVESNQVSPLRGTGPVIFAAAGYGWVTSHIYRKTVATLMDEAGLTARQAAD